MANKSLSDGPERSSGFAQTASCAKSAQAPDGAKVAADRLSPTGDTGSKTSGQHPIYPERTPGGTWAEGNAARRTHGGRALQLHGPQTALEQLRLDTVRAGLMADRGGESELTTAETVEISRAAELSLLAELYWQYLTEHGPMTERGRTRAALTTYLQVCGTLSRTLDKVGRGRRSRDLSDDLSHWLQRESAE